MQYQEEAKEAVMQAFRTRVGELFREHVDSTLRAKGNESQQKEANEQFRERLRAAVESAEACLSMTQE